MPPFDGPGVHELLEGLALVLLPWLEHKGDWFALALGRDIQFGREPALTAPERFGFRVPFFAPAAC